MNEPENGSPTPTFSTVEKAIPISVQIAHQLINAINNGRLRVGDSLPSEKVLAEQFSVSRTTVREALSSLQFVGYVESRHGLGTIVRTRYPERAGFGRIKVGSPTSLIRLFEARLIIEPEAVRVAASDPAAKEVRTLTELLEGMRLIIGRPEWHIHTDTNLHLALVRTCKNTFLAQAAEQLILSIKESAWLTVRDEAWDNSRLAKMWFKHHQEIVSAVAERSPDHAARTMREHLLSALRTFIAKTELSQNQANIATELHSRYSVTDHGNRFKDIQIGEDRADR